MKATMHSLNIIFLAVGGMALLAGNAQAQINLVERERIQSIVWAVEFGTFVIVMAIAWFVWRISRRDYKNKRSKQDYS